MTKKNSPKNGFHWFMEKIVLYLYSYIELGARELVSCHICLNMLMLFGI